MGERKPCPFCGGVSVSVVEGRSFRWRVAVCDECGADECGARGPEVRIQTLPDRGMRPEDVTDAIRASWEEAARAEALEAWNTRAGDSHE